MRVRVGVGVGVRVRVRLRVSVRVRVSNHLGVRLVLAPVDVEALVARLS